jgi:hypothetical protein
MPNLNVGVFGVPGYSRELGKKGTESDITFYNLKRGETTITLLEPTRYPEKLASLFYASSFADTAVLVVDSLDAALGEMVLMLHCAGPSRGIIVTRNYIADEQVARLTRGTRLEKYVYSGDAKRPTLTVSLDRPLVHPPGSAATMTYLDGGKLRVVGKICLQ